MNTNGALKSTDWWQQLGVLFNQQQDYVVFSIDGLEDTNHLYRKGVNWNLLMNNVRSFINAGGLAHWDMLVFEHNKHQVDQCQELAYKMGFSWFRSKVSKRPFIEGVNLSFPRGWVLPKKEFNSNQEIKCHALSEQSVYINAKGQPSPCCWLGGQLDNTVVNVSEIENTWKTSSPHPICAKICSVVNNRTIFENQWQKEIFLKELIQ
jgi:sulfatase maturation enzyme AslB (radical SAM superfamily)